MATFNLLITYPDGEGPRIVAALRKRYSELNAAGVLVVPTQAQAIEALRQSVLNSLRDIVLTEEREAAVAAAAASIVPVNPT